MFFLTYYEFGESQQQHKFWTLTAITDILSVSIKCRLEDAPIPVNIAQTKSVMMDLLRVKGPEVLNQLTIPKFGKIFIQLVKLDNLRFDAQNNAVREWPVAISDLVGLPMCSSDVEH